MAPDVGGGFGSKIYHYGEEALVLAAAKKLRRPVRWTAERSESFLSDAHGRDHVTKIELACDKDGNFLAIRTETLANVGAYLSNFSTATPTFLHGTLMAGPYKVPHVYVNVKTVFTNTAPVDAYRGAGRPEATYSLERVIDKMCRELGLDPFEVRRKNFITPDMFPYTTPGRPGLRHRQLSGDAGQGDRDGRRRRLRKARAPPRKPRASCAAWACPPGSRLAASRRRNLVGILGARVGLYDAATVRVNATGNISVMVGAHSHGQGHETVFAQIVADKLGIPESSVEIVHGDTAKIPFGMGSYGSRSLAVCGSAMTKAVDKIIAKGKKIAAHMLEASEGDITFEDGKFSVAGTDKAKTFGEIAFSAYVPHNYPLETLEPGLEETAFYDPANFTYPAGAYLCEVEVDEGTGKVDVVAFHCADDFGNIMNPMIVEGQVHGGVGQGIGQALCENTIYDENGQLLTGSYMDYAMPRAEDVPFYNVDYSCQTPCTHNPLGREGLRRGRGHRLAPGGGQRGDRRAAARRAHPRHAYRHAGLAVAGLVGDQRLREDKMHNFDFVKPSTIADAVKALAADGAQALSGGQTLIPTMKQRLAAPAVLVSLTGIAEMKGVCTGRRRACTSGRPRPMPSWRARRPSTIRRWPRWPAASATRRCATAAPSAAASPTTTRRPAIRRRCWPRARRW